MNKKILISLSVIALAAAITVGGTIAYFSDTETSTGNTFTAGAIDLTIDNTSYAIDYTIPDFDGPTGALVASPLNTWSLVDLTVEKFFNFVDLKPGDFGEDTISIHVNNNDSYVCAAARITADDDNDITEPEKEDGDNDTPFASGFGELDEELNFIFWADDGDNVLEVGENIFLAGTLEQMGQAGQIPLADSTTNVWTGQSGPVDGGEIFYIGKAWCFGNLTPSPVANDASTNPVERGATGISCDGTSVDNKAQTDSVVGDLEFYAEQSRNNTGFSCISDYTPSWGG